MKLKETNILFRNPQKFVFFLLLLSILFSKCSENDDVKKTEKATFAGFSPGVGGEHDFVTITGSNFSSDISRTQVMFGDYPVSIASVNKDEILVQLPQFMSACGDVDITVISDTTTLVSKTKFNLACPLIESFSPGSGDHGDIITINGSYFTTDVSRIRVTIGSGIAQVLNASTSVINVKLLGGYSGSYPIKVEIQNKVGVSSDLFRINGPTINGYSPSIITGCDEVIISGSDFSLVPNENEVRFGYLKGEVLSATSSQLVVAVPPNIKELTGASYQIMVTVNGKIGVSSEPINVSATSWMKVDPLGDIARWRGVGFAIDQKGYAGTGSVLSNGYAELKNDFWEYNSQAGTWTRKADLPAAARLDAIGFSIAGKGYMGLGGDHSNVLFKDFWEYDPSSNSWQQMPDFPGESRAGAIAFTIAGYGYIGAGWGFGDTNDIWKFDPINQTWTKETEYPGAGSTGMVCFAIGNKAYIGTGFLVNDFWEYTPATKQWRQLQNFPEPFLQNSVSFSFNNYGIAATGNTTNGDRSNHVWKYDPLVDKWSRLPDFGGAVRNFGVGFPLENTFLIGTGSTSFNVDATNEFYKYGCQD